MESYENPDLSYLADLERERDELAAAVKEMARWMQPGFMDDVVSGVPVADDSAIAIVRRALAKVDK